MDKILFLLFLMMGINVRAYDCTQAEQDAQEASIQAVETACIQTYYCGPGNTLSIQSYPRLESHVSDNSQITVACYRDDCLGGTSFLSSQNISTICGHPVRIDNPPPEPPPRCPASGSIIHPDTQVVGESIPVVGAPFSLNYFTNRISGRLADCKLMAKLTYEYPETGISTVGIGIYDVVTTAQVDNQTYGYSTLLPYDFTYVPTTGLGTRKFILERTAQVFLGHYQYNFFLGSFRAETLGLGGWFPSNWYYFDVPSSTLYRPDGTKWANVATNLSGGELRVVEEDGSQVYEFDADGRHLRTKTPMLGSTLVTFSYTGAGYLDRVTERNGRYTEFNRNLSGDLTSITAASGKTTNVTLTADGYLETVTDPLNKVYTMTYTGTKGMLATFEKPTGETNTFTYDFMGNLTM